MLWGLLSFPLAPRTGTDRVTFWLDTTTVTIGGGMLVWHFIVHPLALAYAQDAWQLGLTVLSPVCDMVLLVSVLTLLLRGLDGVQRSGCDRSCWAWWSSAWRTCFSDTPICRAPIGQAIQLTDCGHSANC